MADTNAESNPVKKRTNSDYHEQTVLRIIIHGSKKIDQII